MTAPTPRAVFGEAILSPDDVRDLGREIGRHLPTRGQVRDLENARAELPNHPHADTPAVDLPAPDRFHVEQHGRPTRTIRAHSVYFEKTAGLAVFYEKTDRGNRTLLAIPSASVVEIRNLDRLDEGSDR